MISRDISIKAAIIVAIVGFGIYIIVDLPSSIEEKNMFPGILGDMILENNETGKRVIKNMTWQNMESAAHVARIR